MIKILFQFMPISWVKFLLFLCLWNYSYNTETFWKNFTLSVWILKTKRMSRQTRCTRALYPWKWVVTVQKKRTPVLSLQWGQHSSTNGLRTWNGYILGMKHISEILFHLDTKTIKSTHWELHRLLCISLLIYSAQQHVGKVLLSSFYKWNRNVKWSILGHRRRQLLLSLENDK